MTTPLSSAQVGNDSEQFWPGVPNSPDLLLVNLDQADNITVGPKGIQPNAANGYVIPPLDAISLPGTVPWSAVTDSANPPLRMQILPGGGNWSASALAIAGQIADSGLALAIAEEIAANGLTLVGAPVPLYGGPVTPVSPSSTIFGSTMAIPGPFPAGTTYAEAATSFDTVVSRVAANGMEKTYLSEGQFPGSVTSDGRISLMHTKGGAILVSAKPSRTMTTAQQTAFVNFLTMLSAAGFTSANCWITLWQEANSGNFFASGADYLTYVNYYWTAAADAVGFPLVFDPAVNTIDSQAEILSYYQTGTFDVIAVDFYANDYNDGKTIDFLQAQANTDGIPFAIAEFGEVGQPNAQESTEAQWNQYVAYLQQVLQAVTTSVPFILYYNGVSVNPNNIAPASGTPYSKVPQFDDFFDTWSNISASRTIGAGATISATPITASPIAGYAAADGLGYEIQVNLIAGASSTYPFAQVSLIWYQQDSASANIIAKQTWVCPMGTSTTTGTVINGRGPQHGQFLAVEVTNLDTVSCKASLQLNSVSRSFETHDWIWDAVSSVTVPGYTLPSAAGTYANVIGEVANMSIAKGATDSFLFGLFAGQAFVRFFGGSGSPLQYVLSPVYPSNTGAIVNQTPAGEYSNLLVLPRIPTVLAVTNTDAVNAHTANAMLIARD